MNYTTIEQSNKLLELGLNPNTADAHWWITDESKVVFFGYNPKVADSYKGTMMEYLPCWTLGALIELMPSAIGDSIGCKYSLSVSRGYVEYINSDVSVLYARYHDEIGDNTLEACYNMIVWLLENGRIKTNN